MLCVVLCTVSSGFVLDCLWNYNELQLDLLCVVLFTVSGGFVLDCIWNYNVLQFV